MAKKLIGPIGSNEIPLNDPSVIKPGSVIAFLVKDTGWTSVYTLAVRLCMIKEYCFVGLSGQGIAYVATTRETSIKEAMKHNEVFFFATPQEFGEWLMGLDSE